MVLDMLVILRRSEVKLKRGGRIKVEKETATIK